MRTRTKLLLIGSAAVAALAIGAGVGLAAAGDDDQPLTGSALERASAAALAHTGGGTVIETEVGDDGGAYGVEIRTPDGGVVEVTLDADFTVIDSTADDDGAGGEEADGGTD
jgi:uncharacterized membrane protein YkoI